MNAYLKNLAAKNMQFAEVIQPRLASRFEPESRQIRLTPGRSRDQVKGRMWTSRASASHIEDAGLRSGPHPAFPDPDQDSMGRFTSNEPVMPRPSTGDSKKIQEPFPSGNNGLLRVGIDSDRITLLSVGTETAMQPDLSASFQMPGSHRIVSSLSKSQEEMRRIESKDRMSREVTAPVLIVDDKAALKTSSQIAEGSILHHGPNGSNSPAPSGATEMMKGLTGQRQTPNDNTSPSINVRAKPDEVVNSLSVEGKEKRSYLGRRGNHEISEKVANHRSLKRGETSGIVAVQPTVRSHKGAESNARGERMANAEIKPEVQVTIGRIEVRATLAAATPQRKRDYPPEMSLDEYLNIKRGGS